MLQRAKARWRVCDCGYPRGVRGGIVSRSIEPKQQWHKLSEHSGWHAGAPGFLFKRLQITARLHKRCARFL
jgi:hypothetical protein